MKVITLENHIKKYSDDFLQDYDEHFLNMKQAVLAGTIKITDPDIYDYGLGFLFLGPCDQCGGYFDKYVVLTAVDDYVRDIDCLICEKCLSDAFNMIKKI